MPGRAGVGRLTRDWAMYVRRARMATFLCALLFGACGGCAFGPHALEKTHGRYNQAVHDVDDEEFLRNIVRVRYNERPSTLNVASIAAQYELQGQAEARPFFIAPNPSNSNVIFRTFTSILPDLSASAAERPTLSLVPGDDSTAVRQFLTPISADMLVFLTQGGWPVSAVLRLWVERLNGVPNASTTSNPPREVPADYERFARAAELLQAAQDREWGSVLAEESLTEVSGPLPAESVTAAAAVEAAKEGLEYRPREDGKTWALVKRSRRLVMVIHPGAEALPEVLEMEALLNLWPGLRRYELVPSPGGVPDPARVPTEPSTALRLVPRSTAQVFYYISNGVEVPFEHLKCGLVGPPGDTREVTRGLFEVHACKGHKPPPCAFVAVRYRDYWYYIDDRDQASKAAFGMVMQLSRLDFKRQQIGAGPLLTLPAGR
jgi:hypothetical protein